MRRLLSLTVAFALLAAAPMPGMIGARAAGGNLSDLANPTAARSDRGLHVRSVDGFGAYGDGVTDDLPAFQAAIADAVAAGGGEVVFERGPYLVDSADLAIPTNVHLRGRSCTPGGERAGNNYVGIPSTIIVNPAYSIQVGRAATLDCAVVKAKALITPGSTRDQIAMVAGFSGTGITTAGDDAVVRDVLILGFDRCYVSSGFARPVLQHVKGDCTNGARFDNVHDVSGSNAQDIEFHPLLTTITPWNDVRYAVGAAANNGAGAWRLTVPANVLRTGDTVHVAGTTSASGINGRWTVAVVDATHIDLQGSHLAIGTTGNTVSGSPIVYGIAAGTTLPLRIGMPVTGAGIPGGAVVTFVWGNRVYLSANAKATAKGVRLSFGNTPYTTGDATLYINTNRRAGVALEVTNSETLSVTGFFEYGFDTCAHIGDGALWTHLVDVSCDNFPLPADPHTFGVKIDGTATGTHWNGGSVSSYAVPLYVNHTALNGNYTAQTITDVDLNPGFFAVNPIVAFEQGRLILSGVSSNVNAGSSLLAGSGVGITALIVAGSDLPTTVYRPWNAAARAVTRVDAASTLSSGL